MKRLKTNKPIEEIAAEGTVDVSHIVKLANEGTGDISDIIKMARTTGDYMPNEIDEDDSEPFAVPNPKPYTIKFGRFNTEGNLGKFQIDDFAGSKANDGTAFAIGSRNSGTRLVFNYKGISALLVTKYGNFDLGAFDVSDNVTELEFNGVLFKRVDKKEN